MRHMYTMLGFCDPIHAMSEKKTKKRKFSEFNNVSKSQKSPWPRVFKNYKNSKHVMWACESGSLKTRISRPGENQTSGLKNAF